jgi:hypothetical protein
MIACEQSNAPILDFRENARKLQDVIAKTDGLSMAADIVERSFGVIKKPTDRYSQLV